MIKITAFAIICSAVYMILKKHSPEYSVLLEIFAVTAVIIFIVPDLITMTNFSQEFFDHCGIDREYFRVLIKTVGISLLTQFSSDTLRDCGESALASETEFAGKILILVSAAPVIKAVMQTAAGFFGG